MLDPKKMFKLTSAEHLVQLLAHPVEKILVTWICLSKTAVRCYLNWKQRKGFRGFDVLYPIYLK